MNLKLMSFLQEMPSLQMGLCLCLVIGCVARLAAAGLTMRRHSSTIWRKLKNRMYVPYVKNAESILFRWKDSSFTGKWSTGRRKSAQSAVFVENDSRRKLICDDIWPFILESSHSVALIVTVLLNAKIICKSMWIVHIWKLSCKWEIMKRFNHWFVLVMVFCLLF